MDEQLRLKRINLFHARIVNIITNVFDLVWKELMSVDVALKRN